MSILNQQLSTILEKALNVAEKSGEFVINQAPLLLQEFYRWHIVSHTMGAFIFLTTLIPFIYFFKKAKWVSEPNFIDFMAIIFGIGSSATIIASAINVYKLVFILVAPKLYLIEYFLK
jgi:hypothetical protein